MTDPLAAWEGVSSEAWARQLGVRTAEFHASIDSTNRRGRELAGRPGLLPAVVVADRQTQGQGRMGRPWLSDTPDGLWLSLVVEASADASVLSLLAGLAVARGIDGVVGRAGIGRAGIKWPNDVFLSGRKVAGVLCAHGGAGAVVGIGVNVNHDADSLPGPTDVPAGSLRVALGRTVGRGPLLEGIVGRVLEVLDGGAGLVPGLLDEINERSTVRGLRLAVSGTVRHSTGDLESVERLPATGGRVRSDGALELILDGGGTMILIAGSLRPLE